MGFAIANAAAQRGADVTLISGPVALGTPKNVSRIDVETAEQMNEAVTKQAKKCDAIIMSAAVADYTPKKPAANKIKKNESTQGLSLELQPTADILRGLGAKKNGTVLVGVRPGNAGRIEERKRQTPKEKSRSHRPEQHPRQRLGVRLGYQHCHDHR